MTPSRVSYQYLSFVKLRDEITIYSGLWSRDHGLGLETVSRPENQGLGLGLGLVTCGLVSVLVSVLRSLVS